MSCMLLTQVRLFSQVAECLDGRSCIKGRLPYRSTVNRQRIMRSSRHFQLHSAKCARDDLEHSITLHHSNNSQELSSLWSCASSPHGR